MSKEVLIMIPAYNEASNIANLIISLKDSGVSGYCDILVINDASADLTSMIAKRLKVNVVTHIFNLGYGSALQIGYKYAVRGGYKYIIQLDADGQHDICNIPNIYAELKKPNAPDIVLCSRFLKESVSFEISGFKKIAIRYFRRLIRLFTGETITDPTSGLQGMNRNAFLYFSRYDSFDSAYPDANMIIQTIRYGFKYKELPCVMHARETGESMHSGIFKPIFYALIVTLSIFDVVLRDKIFKKRRETEEELEKELDKLGAK